MSPRALRYEFEPGQDARLVLEPWEHVVPLAGAAHNYTERKVTRVWGRRRLKLIEGLLAVRRVRAGLLEGSSLAQLLCGEACWADVRAGFECVLGSRIHRDRRVSTCSVTWRPRTMPCSGPALDLLRSHYHQSVADVAAALGVESKQATGLLVRLCRQGRCMFDVESRRYRHRELFEQPADEVKYFPPDLRREAGGTADRGRTGARRDLLHAGDDEATPAEDARWPASSARSSTATGTFPARSVRSPKSRLSSTTPETSSLDAAPARFSTPT